jgi:hypothetical protein
VVRWLYASVCSGGGEIGTSAGKLQVGWLCGNRAKFAFVFDLLGLKHKICTDREEDRVLHMGDVHWLCVFVRELGRKAIEDMPRGEMVQNDVVIDK